MIFGAKIPPPLQKILGGLKLAYQETKKSIQKLSRKRFYAEWQHALPNLQFRLINQCNEYCDDCIEKSGPNNPDTVFPLNDMKSIIENAGPVGSVSAYGGEPSLVLKKHPEYWAEMFNLQSYEFKKHFTIQTNGKWYIGPHKERIFNDLAQMQKKLAASGANLQLTMSVDMHHSGITTECVKQIVREITSNEKFRGISICLKARRNVAPEIIYENVLNKEYLARHGVKLELDKETENHPFYKEYNANGHEVRVESTYVTLRIGRAADNKIGYIIFNPEEQISGIDNTPVKEREMCVCFREDGTAEWVQYYNWNVKTEFRNADKSLKPFRQVREELMATAYKRRFAYYLKELILSSIPGVQIIHALYDNHKRTKVNESGDGEGSKIVLVSVKDLVPVGEIESMKSR